MSDDPDDFTRGLSPEVQERYLIYVDFLADRGIGFDLSDCQPGSPQCNHRLSNGLWTTALALLGSIADKQAQLQPERFPEIWQACRDKAYGILFRSGRYHEPWLTLVHREFPGTGPTPVDMEAFVSTIGDEVERHLANESEIDRLQTAITRRLNQLGYDLHPSAETALRELAWRASLTNLSPSHRRDLGARQIERLDNPNHWIWRSILAEFFPV